MLSALNVLPRDMADSRGVIRFDGFAGREVEFAEATTADGAPASMTGVVSTGGAARTNARRGVSIREGEELAGASTRRPLVTLKTSTEELCNRNPGCAMTRKADASGARI